MIGSDLVDSDVLLSEHNPSLLDSVSVTEGSGDAIAMRHKQDDEEEEEVDAHICGQCRAEFVGLTAFLKHKKSCSKRPMLVLADDGSRHSHPSIGQTEDAIRAAPDHFSDKDAGSDSALEATLSPARVLLSGAGSPASCSTSGSHSEDEERLSPGPHKRAKPVVAGNEWPADLGASVVLTRRLQNTSVAVAQQLAPSNSEAADSGSPPKTLQATLTSLQQHQLMLMSVIHQMQAQLATSGQEQPALPSAGLPFPMPFLMPPNLTPGHGSAAAPAQPHLNQSVSRSASLSPASRSPPHRPPQRPTLHHRRPRGVSSSPPAGGDAASKGLTGAASVTGIQDSGHKSGLSLIPGSGDTSAAPPDSSNLVLCPTGNKTANSSNNSNNNDKEKGEEAGEAGEGSALNTLELLQLHTEKALQNTMSGSSFLANGISGLGGPDFLKFRKDGKEDPSYRHRCRYCGKVFGSDSALQIHIRSHTGERPFKCNICGNRFSTKGNLKVHFQRHKTKYPHIKMNPNPVPEHLDKFHPPLEPPSGSQSPTRSDSSPPPPPPPHTSPYSALFAPSSSSTPSAFDGMRSAFQAGCEFPSIGSRLASFISQADAGKSGHAARGDRQTSRSPPNLMLSNPHDANRALSAVSFSHSNDASNLSLLTEESDHESVAQQERTGRKKRARVPDEPLELRKGESVADRNGDAKRPKESYFLKDRQIKQEKSGENDDEDEDGLSGGEEESTANDRNGHSLKSKDRSHDQVDSSNADSSTGHMDEDDSDGQSNQSSATGPASFAGLGHPFHNYFPPGMFPSSLAGMMPPGFQSGLSDRSTEAGAGGTLTADPHMYQDLLPKPGSNDNTWESLMEIQKASETIKLQHLVDNIETKLTDPNQCAICHRVLSCKSALQMHYRTHTGERPFKCKICSRAFTTKGNLKTHMGVHRMKPPLRILHQCNVCHKQFTNALVLQQHIRMHTGEPTDMPLEHIMANEIPHNMALMPFHRHLPPFPHMSHVPVTQAPVNPFFAQLINSQFGQHLHQQRLKNSMDLTGVKDVRMQSPKNQKHDQDPHPDRSSVSTVASEKESHTVTSPNARESPANDLSPVNGSNNHQQQHVQDSGPNPFSVSLTALENHVRTINSVEAVANLETAKMLAIRESISRTKASPAADGSLIKARDSSRNQTISPASANSRDAGSMDGSAASMNATDDQRSSPGSAVGRAVDDNSRTMDSVHSGQANGALDLTPRGSSVGGGVSPMSVGSVRGLGSPGALVRPPHGFPPLFAGLPFSAGKSSTTCQICFKTFACNSALEIHYRSHTKERPFKCDVCDRGFSTKGNMKQHMLTHKIRDLPANLYTTTTTTTSATASTSASAAGSRQPPRTPSLADSNSQTSVLAMTEVENGGGSSRSENGLTIECRDRRSGQQGSSPAAKRSSQVSKHVCSVCCKPFSSHSALQIHMRTHTGDKPFKCAICTRAFTTKGNLKVHMGESGGQRGVTLTNVPRAHDIAGTHMWNNGSSRRGRRMSIDLPNMHVTPPKGADGFPQFFPNLPTVVPYVNGQYMHFACCARQTFPSSLSRVYDFSSGINGQNNRTAAQDMGSMYAAQFQAKLQQACLNNGQKKNSPTANVMADGTRSGDEDQGSRNAGSEDDDSQSPGPPALGSRRNVPAEGSVDEDDGSDDRSTPPSWSKDESCKKLTPSNSKALTAS